MALGKAIIAGAIAALAIPYVVRPDSGELGGLIQRGTMSFSLGDAHLAWSWPVFCIVVLFVWGLLAWANR